MFKSYALLIVSLLISPVEAKQYGPIESGEMLWNIAAQVYADPSVSRHQVMLALLKANPQAFRVPCNMNSLKVNALLTLPELATLQAITPQQALDAFEQQNQAWRNYQQHGENIVCPPTEKQTQTPLKRISATTLLGLDLLEKPIVEKPAPPVAETEAKPLESPQEVLTAKPMPEQSIQYFNQLLALMSPQALLSSIERFEWTTPLWVILAFLVGWLVHHFLGSRQQSTPTPEPEVPQLESPGDESEQLSAKIEEKLAYVRSYLAENEEKAMEAFLQEVLEKGSVEQRQQAQQLLAINRKMSTLELHMKKQAGDDNLPQKYVLEDRDKIFKLVDKIFQLLDEEFQAQGQLLKIYTQHYRPAFFEDEHYKPSNIVVEEDLESTLRQFRQQPPPTRHL